LKKANLRKAFACSIIIFLACSLFFSINNNSVSASGTNQIYWGAWVGTHHIGYPDLLTGFENQVGKGMSIWNWIQIWTIPQDVENVPNFDTALMDQCRQHGAIPMVSWSPAASDNSYNDDSANFTNLQSILDGKWDAYLTAWGQASHAWGHPYFLRLMWEFTGVWNDNTPSNPGYGTYPWGNGNTPAMFVAAWQHIVNKVREAGGTQITWVWCPADVGDSVTTLESVYPGDQYVDWVGTDVYTHPGQTFEQQAQPELDNIRAVAPNKPVMFPEIGYFGTDAEYWSNLLTNIIPNNFPYVKAVLIWEEPSLDLTVVDSTTLPSFQQAIASNYYSSNNYSNLNTSPILPLGTNSNPSATTSSPSQTTSPSSPTPSVPEFSSWIILSLFIILGGSATVVLRIRKRNMPKS